MCSPRTGMLTAWGPPCTGRYNKYIQFSGLSVDLARILYPGLFPDLQVGIWIILKFGLLVYKYIYI